MASWPLSGSSCYAHLTRSKGRVSPPLLREHVLRELCACGCKAGSLRYEPLFLPGHYDESEEIDSRDKETVVGGTDSLSKLWDASHIR